MRTAIYNGKIYLDRGEFAEAVLIEGDTVLQVGTTAEILASPDLTEKIDCEGRTVIPGLNDSHMHLMMIGEALEQLSLENCKSVTELITASKAYLAQHPEAAKKGLYGRAWNQDYFIDEKRIPNRHDLDQISTEIPVVLERICGHILVTNTKAIEMLGLKAGSPQYKGGVFHLEEDGTPNGVFTEDACRYPLGLFQESTLEEKRMLLLKAMEYAVSRGITSVQSNDLSYYIKDHNGFIRMIHSLYEEGIAPLRYRLQACFQSPEAFAESFENGLYSHASDLSDDYFAIGPLKLFKDGSLGARTAMVRHPYLDDPENPDNRGVETTDAATMDRYCEIAAKHGVQVVTHVIGDRAVGDTLDSYEKVLIDGENKYRNSLIHCQLTTLEDLKRIARMGILVQYQPIFLNYDHQICEARVGKELASTSYAFRTLQDLGGKISYGTDSPVEDCNPFENIYCAVTRKGLDGQPPEGFYPQECVDVYTAVDAYTAGSAYCEFAEDRKGRIRAGYLADMVILDKDIFEIPVDEIKNVRPVRTIVGGKTVYRS